MYKHKQVYLYHGSKSGITGDIQCNHNNTPCDFGEGFYTGTNINQAENRISNTPNGIMYIYELNKLTRAYTKYTFTNDILWALYIAYNRKYLDFQISKHPKLIHIIEDINTNDIVIGKIADNKISQVYGEFIAGNITDICLSECLKLVKYGDQVVFKNDAVAKHLLKLKYTYRLTRDMKESSIKWNRELKFDMDTNIETIKNNTEDLVNT